MAITATSILVGGSTVNTTNFTTASGQFPANELLVAWLQGDVTEAGTDPASTVWSITGANITWEAVGHYPSGAVAGRRRIWCYRAMLASTQSGALTLHYAGTTPVNRIDWHVSHVSGVATTGVNGSGAIAVNTADIAQTTGFWSSTPGMASTQSWTLAAFSNSSNVGMGCVYMENTPQTTLTIASPYTVVSVAADNFNQVAIGTPNSRTLASSWASSGTRVMTAMIELVAAGAPPAGSTAHWYPGLTLFGVQ